MFSPGNLRATFDNPNYERLISHYIGEKYTLRYTGGMVPDVFQIIVKEKGVFTNVTSPSTKAKLRILFEVAPLSLLVSIFFEGSHTFPCSSAGLQTIVMCRSPCTMCVSGKQRQALSLAVCLGAQAWERRLSCCDHFGALGSVHTPHVHCNSSSVL